MDFEPTEAEEAVRRTAERFAADVLAPRAAALDREGGFPTQSLAAAAEQGLLSVNVAREYGGLAAGPVAYSLAVTELGAVCASTTVAVCVSNMVAEVIAEFGTADQKQRHIPKLCDGSYVVGAFALSEAGAGSDPGGMRTRARKTDRGWGARRLEAVDHQRHRRGALRGVGADQRRPGHPRDLGVLGPRRRARAHPRRARAQDGPVREHDDRVDVRGLRGRRRHPSSTRKAAAFGWP